MSVRKFWPPIVNAINMAIIIGAPPWLLPLHPQGYHEKE